MFLCLKTYMEGATEEENESEHSESRTKIHFILETCDFIFKNYIILVQMMLKVPKYTVPFSNKIIVVLDAL